MAPSHVRRAVEIYGDHAWPEGEARSHVESERLATAATLDELFAMFDQAPTGGGQELRRWTLRVGNYRYPFMKFVVQEYLVGGEFFFSVDTHDNLDVRPGSPDYKEWQELKRTNRALKEKIEQAWEDEGLPTHEDLRQLAQELAHVEREGHKGARILVVEDEQDVAIGLQALLEARGYQVELCYDGEKAMQRLETEPLIDLLLLDYELPELDGEEVLKRVRSDPRLENLPVLMATASRIEMSRLQRVSGLLRKPYPREVLFTMIAELLAARPRGSEA